MNRSLVFVCAFGVSMGWTCHSLFAAEFTYTSQDRGISVESNYWCEPKLIELIELIAPDFGPFNEAVTLTTVPTTSAQQSSTLSSHAIAMVGLADTGQGGGCAGTATLSADSWFSVTLNVAEPVSATLHLSLEFEPGTYAAPSSYYKVQGPGLDFEASWHDIVLMGAPSSIDWTGVLAPGEYTLEILAHVKGSSMDSGWASSTLTFETTEPGGPADLDGDGSVGGDDLGLMLGAWGPCVACPADLDGDGVVDGADLGTLLGAWTPLG